MTDDTKPKTLVHERARARSPEAPPPPSVASPPPRSVRAKERLAALQARRSKLPPFPDAPTSASTPDALHAHAHAAPPEVSARSRMKGDTLPVATPPSPVRGALVAAGGPDVPSPAPAAPAPPGAPTSPLPPTSYQSAAVPHAPPPPGDPAPLTTAGQALPPKR
jgi:hypothetical protein